MIDTDKYEGHTQGPWEWSEYTGCGGGARLHTHVKDKRRITDTATVVHLPRRWLEDITKADKLLIADAPLLLEIIEKVVEEWARPNACPKSFGKEVRSLLLEYGLINFNEETRRYEVKE